VVEAFELEELRRPPMEKKLMQLCALMASRDLFAEDPERDKLCRDLQNIRVAELRELR